MKLILHSLEEVQSTEASPTQIWNNMLNADFSFSHTQLSTNEGKDYDYLQVILNQRKSFGMTSATARTNMNVSASVAFPAETNMDVSASVAFPAETNMDVSASVAFPAETNMDVSPSVAVPAETNMDVSASAAVPAETNMDVSASVAVPAETNNIAAHVHCVDEMSPKRFLRLASQRMDTLEVTEKDFNLLTDIAYKATVLSMRIKEKKAEDLKRDGIAPTVIPGLTLIEQSYGSPPTVKSEFLEEAEDMYQDKNSAPSIEQSNASTVKKELVEEAEDMYQDKNSTPSIEQLNASTVKKELVEEAEDMYQDKNSTPSIEQLNASTVKKELVEEAEDMYQDKNSAPSIEQLNASTVKKELIEETEDMYQDKNSAPSIEQSNASTVKKELVEEAEDMYQDKNSAPSIEQSNASTVKKELVEEARDRLCNKSPSTSVAAPTEEPLISAKIISDIEKILKKLKNNNDNKKIALLHLPPAQNQKISTAEQRNLNDEASKSIIEFIDYLEACKRYELSPVRSELCNESPSTSIATPAKEPLNSAKIISEVEKLVKKLIEINEANKKFAQLPIPPTEICKLCTAKQTRLNDEASKSIREFIDYLEACKGTFLETTNNSCYKSPATSGEQSHASVPTVGRKFLPEIRKHIPVYETPTPTCTCPFKDFHYVDCSLRHTTLNKF
ncbi:uncharacterized protein LOC129960466 isoform X2 [Argiope bruennichi]|uniref:uncharacterized protein LOC129960466 isoform X2 n=1 Tax=Argiope bruennichi TaxID=94029 RepID=UPI0024941A4A|nr:uncharacterized protein LOC129960466 isoform X2 [Argiope bruennichi]